MKPKLYWMGLGLTDGEKVGNSQERHTPFCHQQGGGYVMIWAGIIGDELVGPV